MFWKRQERKKILRLWYTRRRIRCTEAWKTLILLRKRQDTILQIGVCDGGLRKTFSSTFIHPTAAAKEPGTSTYTIMPVSMASERSCSGKAASMATSSSATQTRAG